MSQFDRTSAKFFVSNLRLQLRNSWRLAACLLLLAVWFGGTLSAQAQAGTALEWTWMGGSTTGNAKGIYGTLGVPAVGNIPGSRYNATTWTDGSGDIWLFGGNGFDSAGNQGWLNDLWEFNPSTTEWAWMSGSSTVPQTQYGTGGNYGVYGTLGTPAPGNAPGSRSWASSWTDSSGNLWLFSGEGFSATVPSISLDDLWEFTPSTGEWTWMGGSSSGSGKGLYGSLGQTGKGNLPGSRSGASTWTDSSGNLWLFGGDGEDANGAVGYLNDFWEFSPLTNEWAWMGGSSTVGSNYGQPGVYGTLRTPAAGNIPAGRVDAVSWTDKSGHFWLFGGNCAYSTTDLNAALNDLWEFDPSANEWAWMGGSSTFGAFGDGQPGVYGTLGTPSAGNVPGGRMYSVGWTDKAGNLWLFGGINIVANGKQSALLNDLWEFSPSTNAWAWMAGSNSGANVAGVYGMLGMPAAGNVPGSRYGASGGTDSRGYLWLFGGLGGYFRNDVWRYQPQTISIPVTMTVNSSSSRITTAQALTVITVVSGGSGNPTPTGAVTLTSGSYSAQQILAAGSATFSVAAGALAVGSDTLSATYTPDSASTGVYTTENQSVTVMVTTPVGTSTSTVTATPSATTVTNLQAVTVAVSIAGGSGQPTPTGTITLAGGTYSAQQALASGKASFSIPAGTLSSGASMLTASYSGDGTYAVAIGTTTVTVSQVVVSAQAISVISPGATATATVTLTAGSAFSGPMNLTCVLTGSPTGAQSLPTCSVNPTSVTIASGGNATTILTVNTTAASTAAFEQPLERNLMKFGGGGTALAVMLMCGIPSRRRRWMSMLILLFAFIGSGAIGCVGGASAGAGSTSKTPGTTAGSYTFTVTATNGTVTAAATVPLSVQ